MDIARLNVKVSILQNAVTVDAIGNHTNSWQPYYSCYATVSSEGGKEMTDAGMVVDDSTADFTVRWCKRTAAITSTGFRVESGGILYDILSVDHMNFRHKSIKLKCQKAGR